MKIYLASFSNRAKEYGGGEKQEEFYTDILGLKNRLLSFWAINGLKHKESKESFKFYEDLCDRQRIHNQS